jgi:lipid II isoglutaminyl synthase (glutamine-hydrolysing)
VCADCGLRTPNVEVSAAEIRLDGVEGSDFVLRVGGEPAEAKLPLPGMYNVYNSLGAAAAASTFGLDAKQIAKTLQRVTPAFGRMERLEIEGRRVILTLAKNPAGLNEVLRTVVQSGPDLHLMMLLNDRIADGRDVSWIWDADVELLAGRVQTVVFSGTRAEDMALRFKYAGAIARSAQGEWTIEHDVPEAFRKALDMTPDGQHLFILPTYTALLDIRRTLLKLGHVRPYWEA